MAGKGAHYTYTILYRLDSGRTATRKVIATSYSKAIARLANDLAKDGSLDLVYCNAQQQPPEPLKSTKQYRRLRERNARTK